MRYLFRFPLMTCAAMLCGLGCLPPADDGEGTGSGGGAGMSVGSGGRGTAGDGGGSDGSGGAVGSGGIIAGTGGRTGGTGSGGSVGGTGGRTSGTGGNGAGLGGRGGGAGSGTGSGGVGVGGAGPGDDYVSAVTIKTADVDNDPPRTPVRAATILVVRWTQTKGADQVWLEFTFPGGTMMTSRPSAGTTGAHRDVVLGVPAATDATIRIVSKAGGTDYKSREYTAKTGNVPANMPKPMVSMYDPALASPDRWLFGSVEDSTGGCNSNQCYYNRLFWLYIMDRQGRIVWYYSDFSRNTTPSFQRIARDGEYIWIEHRPYHTVATKGVLKISLDRQFEKWVDVPGITDCVDVTSDGSLLYDQNYGDLKELTKAGTTRAIWTCSSKFTFQCYTNTINWDPASDSVMMSFPDARTVVQISRKDGTILGQYGAYAGSYTFQPSPYSFGFQHFANITKDGTLMVSSHLPDALETSVPKPNHHSFQEWEIDRTNKKLIQKWIYTDGPEWAMFKGMAIKLPNNNVLANYGTGGVIREITPDKKTVFYVKFDVAGGTNDYYNKMVGHNVLVNDLYALNGVPKP